MIGGLVAFLGTAALSWLLTGMVRRYALRAGVLDVPNERSLHRSPTPRGGGVAVVLVTAAGLAAGALLSKIPAAIAWAIGAGGFMVAAVGWLDDRRGVSPRARALVHAAAACWAAYWIWGALTAEALVGVLCITWAINLYNFMDGIDGLAAVEASSVGSIAGALLVMSGRPDLATVAFLVAAAASGFLRWNWPPARIFMGDVGSGFLGFTFGTLSLFAHAADALPIALSLLLGGVFAFDATVTLLRRAAHGERWHQPHRSHAYQRLVEAGNSHGRVSGGALLLNVALGVLAWLAQSDRISVVSATVAGFALLTLVYLDVERHRPMFSRASLPPHP